MTDEEGGGWTPLSEEERGDCEVHKMKMEQKLTKKEINRENWSAIGFISVPCLQLWEVLVKGVWSMNRSGCG